MVKSFFIYSNNKNKDKAIYTYSKNYMFLTSSSTLASWPLSSETRAFSSFFFCSKMAASLWVAIFFISLAAPPVPAGINRPTITFSLRPMSLSLFPWVDASVNTLVVSWKDAAEMKLLVWRLAFVIPSRTGPPFAGSYPF